MVSDFPYHKELLLKERICSLWEQILKGSKFFPFEEVSILKRDIIEENHCLIEECQTIGLVLKQNF